ncbi:MAG: carbohydrate binding domain-containing protein, partial [Verrucomicrobia bacterium]|nr:carbohydrate binding domain-containing protein [Verrucomicrobiota bacterium]
THKLMRVSRLVTALRSPVTLCLMQGGRNRLDRSCGAQLNPTKGGAGRHLPGHAWRCWVATLSLLFFCLACLSPSPGASAADKAPAFRLQKRWLFVWRDMNNAEEVERMIARFPRAAAAGYNGVVFSYNIAPSKAARLKEAAKQNGLELVAIVMGGAHDRNYAEGVRVQDALFVAHDGRAILQPDNPTRVVNGDFENTTANHFNGWTMQDDEGVTTFADHEVTHRGKTSLLMENIGKNQYGHCRLAQPLTFQPHRQYRISFWVKTQSLTPADPEVKVLSENAQQSISFQTFHAEPTQDWKRYDLVFNSLDNQKGRLYLGCWSGKTGKLWWDDLTIEEIGLVNVLRRPGCPVTVRGEDGTAYEEERDFERVVDPVLNPWHAWHEAPTIRLNSEGRIKEGARLRVSYYHPIIVYEDRVTSCLSEPRIFEDWRQEVKQAEELFHPAAYLMSHDELRVMNQCALCQSKHLTPGELLAWNVKQAAQIIRELRPDAEIWVWSDMFDPLHNAIEHYYAVDGPLTSSWKGLDKGIGIVNWHGGLKGKNCKFFADLGLRQVLSGYYDGDKTGAAIAEWQRSTESVTGIVGAMYTTWEDKYDAMDAWARQAWDGKASPAR